MLSFEVKVTEFIKKHRLLEKGDSVLVGVSGGPDSLALVHYLFHKKDYFSISLTVAHVDHMLRGQESYEDLLFVEEFCHQLGVHITAARINIEEKVHIEGNGFEETARKYRYQFYDETMKKFGLNKLVLGHHGDDQIETILMRLTRGSSGKGRAGIPLRRKVEGGELIRPLLCITKKEIEEYCNYYQLKPRKDPSNQSAEYTRNRFRMEILPFLKKENSHVHEHFQRFSEELLEDESFLQALTEKEMNKVWNKTDDEITINIKTFSIMPLPLQRRGIQLILNYLYKENPGTFLSVHIDAVLELIANLHHPSGKLDLPLGLTVIRSYERCRFAFARAKQSFAYEFILEDGAKVNLPNGYLIQIKKGKHLPMNEGNNIICIHANDIKFPITVRTKRNGDRMKVKGLNGTKKVKDIFIDKKVPIDERELWPIVTDHDGIILWIPGLKKSCYDKPPVPNEAYYILQYCKQSSSRGQQS
ncbi:tRNA(Ile)-lysidine synthetase [Heyndrickxia shackletonii]|uniref:tRNA(Ile)-lysidine synthase n=1 Tax=Heyndrickxia shackletonii TaxID=157838 RepID=A0A0Q3TBC8_9BACI|nr:tRNA lysidine(34) synthetase TilS [Heyndrickxia shackletonii]KQL51390.1 tRNA(Ile)-lysidine synthetase [Heyndrickxia shackletonii]MBB2481424.1 tRNA lysidine(34) synthetase TilS [Bacillus sp. APMAM]NEZ01947.1 tRNA lysidine(34) synthetase TilS [Heyndrickxia shackletonii]RTZ55197.1 tRNA lysidine(34) synthetase TilS [Bacillus sp. SAJ1]